MRDPLLVPWNHQGEDRPRTDDSGFDEFFAGSQRRLTGQLYAMLGDRDEARDCVQEAFVRAWAHREQLDRDHDPEAWVRTTVYRLADS